MFLNDVLVDLLLRYEELLQQGESPTPEEICRDHPEQLNEFKRRIEALRKVSSLLPEDDSLATVVEHQPRKVVSPAFPRIPGFEILAELGRGGMGIVYKARQIKLNRLVALKMVKDGAHSDKTQLARFLIEAKAVAHLQHPHIVQIHEIGEHRQLPYFSLEFVEGGNLAEKIAGSSCTAMEAAAVLETLAHAVQAAHQRGIIHRDLKPANVLLTKDGLPKIADFGLAKTVESAGHTLPGVPLGTPSYMAPEQALGKTEQVGRPADVYALGGILYAMLTGSPPFRGENASDTIYQVIHSDPVSPSVFNPKMPPDLETICLKCLHKEPSRRYHSALELAEDLRRFQAGEPIIARPVSTLEKAVKWTKRKPSQATLLAVSLAAALMLLIGWLAFTNELRDERNKARTARDEEKERAGELAIALANTKAARESEQKKAQELQQQQNLTKDALTEATRNLTNSYLLLSNQAWQGHSGAGMANHYLYLVPEPFRHTWEWHYSQRIYQGGLFTLYGHTEAVTSAAFSADGSLIVSGSADKTVRLWDPRTGQSMKKFQGHSDTVTSVALSSDGSLIVSGSWDKTVRLWDAKTGQTLHVFQGHAEMVTSVALSADDSRIVTGSRDNTMRLWDAKTGQTLRIFQGHTDRVTSVALSADASLIVSGSHDTTVRLWDAKTGQTLHTLHGHADVVTSVALSADGGRIVSGSQDKTVRLWDAKTGKSIHDLEGHSGVGIVTSVALSADGSRIVSGSQDKTVRLWDAKSGQLLQVLKGHADWVASVALSGDGARIVSGSDDKTLRLWDAKTGQHAQRFHGHTHYVNGTALSKDGNRVVSGALDNTVRLWDARTGQVIRVFKGHTRAVTGVALSADGSLIVSGSHDTTVRLWDAKTGQTLHILQGHADAVTSVALSSDGSRIVSGSVDTTVRLWDAKTGTNIRDLKDHTGWVNSVAMSGDGNLIVSTSEDNSIRLWDAKTGQTIKTFQGHSDIVTSVALSSDGSHIVSGSRDETVRLWDAKTGQTLHVLRGHSDIVTSVALSSDGSRIVSGSRDATLRLWDARTSQPLRVLRGHTDGVNCVAMSGDGACIVSGSRDKMVWLWDGRTSQSVRILQGHADGVNTVALSSDGAHVVSGSQDRTVRLWDAKTCKSIHVLRHADRVHRVALSKDGLYIISTDVLRNTIVWDAKTGQALPDFPVPALAPSSNSTPDEQYFVVRAGQLVLIVSTQLDEDEHLRRLWLTRPDPEWHIQKQLEFEKEKNTYATALHRSFEQHARGVVAFDACDFDQAFAHLIAAAALRPAAPAPK